MAVGQHMQRLQLLIAEAGRSHQTTYIGPRTIGPGTVGPSARGHWLGLFADLVCMGVMLAADTMAFVISAVVVGVARFPHGEPALPLALCALAGLVGYFAVLQDYGHRMPFLEECRNLVCATCSGLVLASAASFLLAADLRRGPLLGMALLFPLTVIALRCLARSGLETAGLWRVPVVVVGEGDWAAQAEADLHVHAELGYDVVARVNARAEGANPAGWARLLRQHGARLLVLAIEVGGHVPTDMMAALVRERIPYAILPQTDGLPAVGGRKATLGQESVMLSYRNTLRKPAARAVKLTFDLAIAGTALLVLAPAFAIIAGLVSLDGGPVFYAHKRVGARGRVFKCLKFRSMVTHGERVLEAVLRSDPAAAEEWARTHKLRRDPRVTWIGRFLRKTSLDELPQLLNVLRMEMSLVGPRPIVGLEVPKYADDIAYYYETRPGITGLWQVSGRSDTSYAERVRLDSWYVKNWTLWQDLCILARTVPAVISGRGAG